MPALLLAIAAGVLAASCFSHLPPLHLVWWLIPFFVIAGVVRQRWLVLALALAAGCSWGVFYGHRALSNILPEALVGQELLVRGRVTDIPLVDPRRQRFVMLVEQASTDTGEDILSLLPARIQLSWYDHEQVVVAGERWQFHVRLKQPRSFVNPGGFDYEAWLLRRQIGALGYVRKSVHNLPLAAPRAYDVSHWRYSLREWLLNASDSPRRAVLLALLIGDRSLIDSHQWRTLQHTGTNHLIAISGLHVGFVALLGLLLGNGLGRLINLRFHQFPPLLLACLCASSFALFYSALAGFSLPTQRALIMVLVAQYALVMRRSVRPRDGLVLAFVLVLLRDPLAAYDPGFWLSFGAVAVLLLAFVGRVSRPGRRLPGRSLFYSQWVIFIGLLLPLALLTDTTSLLAPVANVVAIPLVTFVVVPALLVAAASRDILPGISNLLVSGADLGLQALFWWLEELLNLADGRLYPALAFNPRAVILAAIALLLILLPRALPGRWLGYPMLFIALLIPVKIRAPLQITVMDVGQGLAVVIQTPSHSLIYDVGPAYGDSFDAGSGILAPYLRQQGLTQVDKLVISHNDSDHAGGLQGLLEAVEVGHVYWGEPARPGPTAMPESATNCHTQPPWEWDQVRFRFLSRPLFAGTKPNDSSCVLLVEYRDQTILLPGDISQTVEQLLLAGDQLPPNINLLLAAHHGSRSSSSPAFVTHTRPEMVVFSAGYRNQHGHPHPKVVARFDAVASRTFNTAQTGALEFIWDADKPVQVIEYRQRQRRYWHQ